DLPGYELFQYVDDSGEVCRVDSADVNRYIHDIVGQDYTAKDFRTWAGTVLAAKALDIAGRGKSEGEGKRKIVAAIKEVARQLGNRVATCRKYYVHPAIIEAYSTGSLSDAMREGERQNDAHEGSGLRPEEYAVITTIAAYQEKLLKDAKVQHRRAA